MAKKHLELVNSANCRLRRLARIFLTLVGMAVLVLFSFFLSTIRSQGMAVPDPMPQTPGSRRILVFGGNGFLGSETVERLLKAGHQVTVVNRGNWYWDSAFRVKPFVTHIGCDRLFSLNQEHCGALVDLVNNNGSFDLVIDFSAYHLFSVQEALTLLKGQPKLYIYISTDSVYDVCEKNHSEPSRETDAVRPQDPVRQQELNSVESYGHQKLLIEEELAKQREGGGIPYISLRLPDVIGPRDNTYRWWIYQLWMKLSDHLEKTPAIPENLVSTPMSLVYVKDVADLIAELITPRPEALDQAFNLALKETPTLLQLLTEIKNALKISELPITTDSSNEAIHMFPSVRNGPIDISKAQDVLGWSPTPFLDAVRETVDFHEKAIGDPYFYRPRKDVIRMMQSHFTSRPFRVLLGIKKHYGVDLGVPKDEL